MANKPRRGINLLSPKTIDSFISKTAEGDLAPKTYADGGGLYLQVTERGASWLRRFTFAGVRRARVFSSAWSRSPRHRAIDEVTWPISAGPIPLQSGSVRTRSAANSVTGSASATAPRNA